MVTWLLMIERQAAGGGEARDRNLLAEGFATAHGARLEAYRRANRFRRSLQQEGGRGVLWERTIDADELRLGVGSLGVLEYEVSFRVVPE